MKQVPINGSRGLGTFAIVDDADFGLVTQYRWHLDVHGYARTHLSDGTTTSMHRLIMRAAVGVEVDHRDCDPLNNRRNNLRPATRQQNGANQGKRKNNTSGYKGVVKQRDKWVVRIMVDRKQLYVGQFKTVEEAALAYNAAAIKHFGEFAALNEIRGGE